MHVSAESAVLAAGQGPKVTSKPTAVHLVTLGCARNEVDSEELAALLERDGFTLVADPLTADAVMVNTCGFIDRAKEESVDAILEIAELKKSAGGKRLIVTGCLAERYRDRLREESVPIPDRDPGPGPLNAPSQAERPFSA